MFVPCFVMQHLCPFQFCNHLDGEREKAGCLTCFTVLWVCLQCVVMVLSDHIHLFFTYQLRVEESLTEYRQLGLEY